MSVVPAHVLAIRPWAHAVLALACGAADQTAGALACIRDHVERLAGG